MSILDTDTLGELELNDLGVDIPDWIEQDIIIYQLQSIIQDGCASGAYMPAVTYWRASATMNEHGDEVLEFIEGQLGELPKPNDSESWSGMACFYLSSAVELWAPGAFDEAVDAIIAELEELKQ